MIPERKNPSVQKLLFQTDPMRVKLMWNNICLLARRKLLLSDYVIVEGEKVSYYSNLGASTWPAVFRRTRGSSGDAFDVFRGVTVQSRTGLCRTQSLKTISLTSAHSSSLIKAQECCKSVCFTAYGATSLFPYAAAAAAAWTLWHCWTQHILSLLQMYQCMRPAEAVLHSTHYAE